MKRKKMGKKDVDALLEHLGNRFPGGKIQIHYFGRGSWSVWINDWHMHSSSGAEEGSLSAGGSTFKNAVARLVSLARGHGHRIVPGDNCTRSCPYYELDCY